MNSTLGQSNLQIGWPVTKAVFSSCTVFCFPDRLGNGKPYTHENFSSFRTLEELGIEDWDRQIVNSMVPVDRSLAVWTLASTWQMTRISKRYQEGRIALSEGLQWQTELGRWILATIPVGFSTGRQKVLDFIGYDTEQSPEFVFVTNHELANWDKEYLIQWSHKQELWRDPCQLVPTCAERILAFQDGWIYLAINSDLTLAIIELIEDLAHRWDLFLIEGPKEWRWLC